MKVRWLVVALFVTTGLAGMVAPRAFDAIGLRVPSGWLLALALGLAAANVAFWLTSPRHSPTGRGRGVEVHIWLQIAVDIVAVSLLVHAVGSEQTFFAFIYLFHISLACIFFAKTHSIIVVAASILLYLAVVGLEVSGVWPSAGVFARAPSSASAPGPAPAMLVALSAGAIWLVVWYLVTTLSEAVKRRDERLASMNEHLLKIDQEKNMQMLLTTHELKVPFAGIQSNIDVLKLQYWDSVPPEVRAILERIDTRAKVLSERISEMLYLGNLKSAGAAEAPDSRVPVELSQLVASTLASLEQKREERRIRIDVEIPTIFVRGNPERYGVLFSNLLSNALLYSHEGGSVRIGSSVEQDGVRVFVEDHGIGIREDALPHIFEEFYRTKEAAKFNRMSSGIGLAIVREIAMQEGLRIRVTSEEGVGTTFEVVFPAQKV